MRKERSLRVIPLLFVSFLCALSMLVVRAAEGQIAAADPAKADASPEKTSDYKEPGVSEEVVAITSTDEIVSAYGVVFAPEESENGAGIRRECEIRNKGGAQWELAVRLQPEDFRTGARVTAIAATSAGKIIASRIRPLDTQSATVAAAQCLASDDPQYLAKLLALDDEKLRSIVEIRRKKRELLQIRLKELLNPSVSKRIEEIEGTLGYGGEGPIAGRTTPSVLARRVASIESAIIPPVESPVAP